RETPNAVVSSRSLGRRASKGSRPSARSSRRASARPAYAGLRWKSPTRVATRLALIDGVIKATLSRLAIWSMANLNHSGLHELAHRTRRPGSAGPTARRPPRPSAAAAVGGPGPLWAVAGH